MKSIVGMIILSLAIQVGFADQPDFYQINLPVASQADDVRETAIQQGLLKVFIKLSGDENINTHPSVAAEVKRADQYVSEYSYQAGDATNPYFLLVKYDPAATKRFLKHQHIAVWNTNRPTLIVWANIAKPGTTGEIQSADASSQLVTALKQSALAAGQPVIFPLMDIQDVERVTSFDVQSADIAKLTAGSARYQPDGLLVGNLFASDKGVESVWRLILNDSKWQWDLKGTDMAAISTALLKQVNDTVNQYYATENNSAQSLELTLEVRNVEAGTDLEVLTKHLQQLPLVDAVDLLEVVGNTVRLHVVVKSSLGTFKQNAMIGHQLVLQSEDEVALTLVYNWHPV